MERALCSFPRLHSDTPQPVPSFGDKVDACANRVLSLRHFFSVLRLLASWLAPRSFRIAARSSFSIIPAVSQPCPMASRFRMVGVVEEHPHRSLRLEALGEIRDPQWQSNDISSNGHRPWVRRHHSGQLPGIHSPAPLIPTVASAGSGNPAISVWNENKFSQPLDID